MRFLILISVSLFYIISTRPHVLAVSLGMELGLDFT
jgi:hypothetical protein